MNGVKPEPGERCRFRVDSDHPGTAPYLVDLMSIWLPATREFNGQCDCPQFKFRLAGLVEETGRPARCKHIQRASRYMLNQLLNLIADAANEKRQTANTL